MSATNRIIPHDHVTEYVAGTLSPAKSVMLTCQRDICSTANAQIEQQEHVASAVMMDAKDQGLSDDFMTKALGALADTEAQSQEASLTQAPSETTVSRRTSKAALLPQPLTELMKSDTVDWSFFAPGIKSASIYQSKSGEHIWMMKVKGGMNMPEHTHIGEEWSLILQGSYHVGTTQYSRGDLHVEDEHCTHIPKIDPGVDCICLVLTEGPLMPTKLLPKLLMPFARI